VEDEIARALIALKRAADMTKNLMDAQQDAVGAARALKLRDVLSDARSHLVTAQEYQAATRQRAVLLEAEVGRLKKWGNDKRRYELHKLAPGCFTYRVKPSAQGNEPTHDLCTNCFYDNVKSVLQYNGTKGAHRLYVCFKCKKIILAERGTQYPEFAPAKATSLHPL